MNITDLDIKKYSTQSFINDLIGNQLIRLSDGLNYKLFIRPMITESKGSLIIEYLDQKLILQLCEYEIDDVISDNIIEYVDKNYDDIRQVYHMSML